MALLRSRPLEMTNFKNLIKTSIFTIPLLISSNANAVFWTFQSGSIDGVLVKQDGTASLNIGRSTPVSPNPADSEWEPCPSNWVRFDRTVDGQEVSAENVNRMLTAALLASNTNQRLRLNIIRNESGQCFTDQIYDN